MAQLMVWQLGNQQNITKQNVSKQNLKIEYTVA